MTVLDIPTHGVSSDASPHVQVLTDRCAGCQECSVRCPTGAITLDAETWTVLADDAACVGCRQCVRTCPFSAITVDGPVLVEPRVQLSQHHPEHLLADRTETRTGIGSWAEALAEAARCLDCPDPTCVRGCPAHNDIPGFIRSIRAGDLDQAHEVLRRTSVLPDICSRVCDQAVQCEGACTWSLGDSVPVAIGALERFICDNAPVPGFDQVGTAAAGMEVAVVGSGPAGIGAAAELVAAGASVTVYERDDEPGGLLRWGIPDFTLPDALARRPWDVLTAAGVDLRLGHPIAEAEVAELNGHYDAVVVAAGASMPLRLPVGGAELDGVWDATRFLNEAHAALAGGAGLDVLRRLPATGSGMSGTPGGDTDGADGPTVLVLGAGNTAMDVARSARRMGARAICVDWRDRRFAPVRPDELEEAAAEGVDVRFSTTLERLEGEDGRVAVAHLARTRQESAGERPEVVAGLGVAEHVDLVVMAMGYRIVPELVESVGGVPVSKSVGGVPDRRWQGSGILANTAPEFARHQPVGKLAIGREHARVVAGLARQDRVWVAGDALVGPSTVVEAMAQGKHAAEAIVHHQPRRPGHGERALARVLVAVESRSGTTARCARQLAEAISGRSAPEAGEAGPEAEVRVLPIDKVGVAELAWADALVVGSWVEGLVVAKVGPARATRSWLAALPPLAAMPVALFCTYAVSPGGTLAAMRAEVEAHGGQVVVEEAISRRQASRSEPPSGIARLAAGLAGDPAS